MYRIALNLLLIGHLLGDFYFQSSSLAETKKETFLKLIIHCVIYFVSMIMVSLPIVSYQIFFYVSIISVAHFLIDYIKYKLDKKGIIERINNDSLIYCLDQFLHIFIIFLVIGTMLLRCNQINYTFYVNEVIGMLVIDVETATSWILMILVIFKPVSVTLKILLNKYQPKPHSEIENDKNLKQKKNDKVIEDKERIGIPNTGSFIGMLERSIILMMLSVGEYGAIGFVLTAKSIARYTKLNNDIQFSEYYLLGTLLSTALVILFYYLII